ncbi:MAG: PfkB family carbohydrate kinase [Kiritimatiellaeota bacterium]|nr:PfkB family carbohydrate kinase [Kiritimatiellota bacterium]
MDVKRDRLGREFARLRIGVVGDFCVDAYWTMAPERGETSVETGIATRPVGRQRYASGGAGTIVNTLAALGVGEIHAFGVVGEDPFGACLRGLLERQGVRTQGLVAQSERWDTHVYAKPYMGDREEARIDFGTGNVLDNATADGLLAALEAQVSTLDAVIINEQIARGIHGSAAFRKRLAALVKRCPKTLFFLDSRHLGNGYPGAILKVNESEAVRLCGGTVKDVRKRLPYDDVCKAAKRLYRKRKTPVVVTRGDRGSLVATERGIAEIPGLLTVGAVDTVGAGDSFLAGFAALMAAGHSPVEAAEFGGFASGVTVQKIGETGTASLAEIEAIGTSPDYVWRPELADDIRQATRLPGTSIEVTGAIPQRNVAVAIFDHDGTISTLRTGWEAVMEPVMVAAVLGNETGLLRRSASRNDVASVKEDIKRLIDQTTGMQTLTQMEYLVDLVRRHGLVPKARIKTAAAYKAIYLKALMKEVTRREKAFKAGKLAVGDVTMRGSVDFLHTLHRAGVKLYLASGTDRDAVEAEAKMLGYADLFEGRIYGAEPGVREDAKKRVLRAILSDIGDGSRVAIFGDGMVEMREGKKAGCLAVGIASDERRRHGLNRSKRARLIRGGADLVIPDFATPAPLLDII